MIKKLNFLMLVFITLISYYHGYSLETKLLRYPDINKNKIVFCYGGDIFISAIDGKNVRRLTSFVGEEMLPKFSPDGEYIAFTAEFEGNKDIYVMPVRGGQPKRLTFHPAEDYLVDWHPDGTKIIFRSNSNSFSYRFNRLQSVSIYGGLPEVLELPEAELSGYNDAGDKIAFCRTSTKTLPWRGYRGGAVPNIWTYDFAQGEAKLVIADSSINHHPIWIGNSIYFISDRDNSRVQNLWVYDCTAKHARQITFYKEWDINPDCSYPSATS